MEALLHRARSERQFESAPFHAKQQFQCAQLAGELQDRMELDRVRRNSRLAVRNVEETDPVTVAPPLRSVKWLVDG